ncbi:MAG: hypothetical protein DVB29_01495 [Verrucomicrobia bacterium]|nr:MAG: hypothetical protein DVB29_01495 [Verrucomicrobiota bacterium]
MVPYQSSRPPLYDQYEICGLGEFNLHFLFFTVSFLVKGPMLKFVCFGLLMFNFLKNATDFNCLF